MSTRLACGCLQLGSEASSGGGNNEVLEVNKMSRPTRVDGVPSSSSSTDLIGATMKSNTEEGMVDVDGVEEEVLLPGDPDLLSPTGGDTGLDAAIEALSQAYLVAVLSVAESSGGVNAGSAAGEETLRDALSLINSFQQAAPGRLAQVPTDLDPLEGVRSPSVAFASTNNTTSCRQDMMTSTSVPHVQPYVRNSNPDFVRRYNRWAYGNGAQESSCRSSPSDVGVGRRLASEGCFTDPCSAMTPNNGRDMTSRSSGATYSFLLPPMAVGNSSSASSSVRSSSYYYNNANGDSSGRASNSTVAPTLPATAKLGGMSFQKSQCFKTKQCRFWLDGRCTRAEECTFAHCDGELRDKPDLTKTKICAKWRTGQCPKLAADCNYAHGVEELRHLTSSVASVMDNSNAQCYPSKSTSDDTPCSQRKEHHLHQPPVNDLFHRVAALAKQRMTPPMV